MANSEMKTERAFCNKCSQKTKHTLIESLTIHEIDPSEADGPYADQAEWCDTTYSFLQCCGCEDACLKKSVWCSAIGETIELEFYPPRVARKRPDWFEILPPEYFPLLDEIYSSLHAGNRTLAMMGARAVLDTFTTRKVGDCGNFKAGLDALVAKNYLAQMNRKVIESAVEAGHAAAHRAYNPSSDVLNAVMDIVENLIQHDVLSQSAKVLKKKLQRRPRRKKNPKKGKP